MGSQSVRTILLLIATYIGASADEGMWLFTNPPAQQLKDAYGFELKPGWLDHLQRSSVSFGGGSGSFVSENGLILTNHHVGAGTIGKLSTAEHDYLRDGFYAEALEDEIPCKDLELKVLVSIEDVTARVNEAVLAAKSPEEGAAARRSIMAKIEKESLADTGLRSEVVTLYRGGAYHLYRYHRYTDVRLVFAPEKQAAAFGGDPDNFEFPRHCLDLCFFRVYENGVPAKTPHYLKWRTEGASEGELTFVSGHPGHTDRSETVAELKYARDVALPARLNSLLRNETLLSNWAARNAENHRRAIGLITGIQNGRKVTHAKLEGLYDPAFIAAKADAEQKLRAQFLASDGWKSAAAAFDEIAGIQKPLADNSPRYSFIEGRDGLNSEFFHIARTLVRAATEATKVDGVRLREFRDSARPQLERVLFSPKPLYKDLEIEKLAASLTYLCSTLGVDDPLVAKIMVGKPPRERATELVNGTQLESIDLRQRLYEGGTAAIAESSDPMIILAAAIDADARALRKERETLEEAVSRASQLIATARFALEGHSTYPDATGTLRLSYGTVKGYDTPSGHIAPFTTLGGLVETSISHHGRPPYDLPLGWEGKAFDTTGKFNFVTTADIIGGNSGSPVVNKAGELVGLVFDGNSSSLILGYAYSDKTARCVNVHTAGMLEALRNIYHTGRLIAEIAPLP